MLVFKMVQRFYQKPCFYSFQKLSFGDGFDKYRRDGMDSKFFYDY